jgi:SAM-dependent methyltransferase
MQTQVAPSPSTEHFGNLMQMMSGYWVTQAIYSAARLDIPDLLKNGPLPAGEVASRLGANEDFLYRLMRTLGTLGILTEEDNKVFRLSAMGQLLCEDTPNSMKHMALMLGGEHYEAWGKLSDGVLSGKAPFEIVYGCQCFEYFEKNPQAGEIFNRAMTSLADNKISAVASAYNFSQFKLLVDVGGGHGRLLAGILKHNPNLSGIVFDLPHVVQGATAHFQEAGVADRARTEGGDFFTSVPADGDAYILSHIIHDWSDELARKILKNIHQAMRPNGKLLLAETVITSGQQGLIGTLMDLNMLVMTPGGRERTEEEYRQLLASAGFRLQRVIPATSTSSLIEAEKL